MAELDTEDMLDRVTLIGLATREQCQAARAEATNNSAEAVLRVLLRKGRLTSWQMEKLRKGNPSGFFFGEYKVLFHLAEGTFARVYRGEQNDSKAAVAVKVLRQRFASMPEAVHRFHKEAEAGMRLRHPNIVRILDEGQQDQSHYMIMEYVEGSNLREFLKLRRWISPEAALPLMIGMAEGLKYSHEEGVTHRDIKKTNILISNNAEAKLVDFGLATIEGDEKKRGVHSQRTVDYSALERTCGSPKGDVRSDIYFLGLVFYEMLTGVSPLPESESKDFLEKMLKRPFNSIKPIEEQRRAPDEALCKIVDKMMKMDLKGRYQNMHGIVSDLVAYRDNKAGPVAAAGPLAEIDLSDLIARPDPAGSAVMESESLAEHNAADNPGESGSDVQVPSFEVKAVQQRRILCVEAQPEIQDALRKNLSQMGFRALIMGDPESAAERFAESDIDAVIFDCDGFGVDSIESLLNMQDTAQEGEKTLAGIVLLGPKQRELQEQIPAGDRLVVLVKPIKMKQIQDAINQLLPSPNR
jgi:serine/threonine protein kinase